jgi:hypothetical protein
MSVGVNIKVNPELGKCNAEKYLLTWKVWYFHELSIVKQVFSVAVEINRCSRII